MTGKKTARYHNAMQFREKLSNINNINKSKYSKLR